MEEIIRLFPDRFQILLSRSINWKLVQEIRLRVNRPIEVLDTKGTLTLKNELLSSGDLGYVLNQISQFSLYRFKDELKEGFITIEGGHRVGLAGKVNTLNDQVETLKHISFMNIRVARSSPGQADRLIPYLWNEGQWANTLIIGAPHSGKTTLLRELAKWAGSNQQNHQTTKVSIVDERSEIAASLRGVPQLDVGTRTDVMDGCPKAEGMMMMIRSMSPDVIVVDEIGGSKDVSAVREAVFTGVQVICSVHGSDLTSVMKRPSTKSLVEDRVFDRYIILERLTPRNPGSTTILDAAGNKLVHYRGRGVDGMDRGSHRINGHYLGRF